MKINFYIYDLSSSGKLHAYVPLYCGDRGYMYTFIALVAEILDVWKSNT